MSIDPLSMIAVYASYHEVAGEYYDKNRLIQEICAGDVQNLLLVVAMLNNQTSINSDRIRADLTEFLAYHHPDRPVREIMSRYNVLFHPQGLLNAAKWMIAYGDFSKTEPVLNQQNNMIPYVRQVILMCMIISDYNDQRLDGEVRFEKIQCDLLRNGNFNNILDISSQTARTLYLLDDLSTIAERAGFDYQQLFYSEYNYSIREYVALLFAIYSIYVKKDQTMSAVNIDSYFAGAKISGRGRAFFDVLTCRPADIKEWALSTLDNAWDFREFWRRPLLCLPCGRIHPLLPSSLLSILYIDLEIKISQLFPRSKVSEIKSQLGRQFEKYFNELASESFSTSRYVSKIIPEFSYDSNKSPDLMVLFGDKLLVIEAKSLRPLAGFAFQDDLEPVQNGVKKIIIDPLNQALERMNELMNRNFWDGKPRPIISEIYVMVVSIVGITSWEPNEDFIASSLKIPDNVPLKGHFHLDIYEFELLCELVTRKQSKPLLHYLNRNNPQRTPFHYFLAKENLYPRRPQKMKKMYNEKMNSLKEILF